MINGTWAYHAGASGTVTLPNNAILLSVYAESHDANGAVQIFGGDSLPLNGGAGAGNHKDVHLRFPHGLAVADAGTRTEVFTLTTAYFVEYVIAPGTT